MVAHTNILLVSAQYTRTSASGEAHRASRYDRAGGFSHIPGEGLIASEQSGQGMERDDTPWEPSKNPSSHLTTDYTRSALSTGV